MDNQMAQERMLDIQGAMEWLNEHGFNYTYRQVQRMSSDRRLPFRRGPDGKKRFVPESALREFLKPGPTR